MDFACGLGILSLLSSDVADDADSLRPVDGYLPVPHTPPVPDADLLDAFAVTDPEQQRWWRARLARVRAELDRAAGP